ncbi:hypothetical protein [Sphingomonas morindae]|uniref:Uncharacterized protein n=1 Tax=Sphingomonas morindae TaxID=1541170 RepID=A0ABY4X7I1_9SPHN|nr:hypothetical protein [Sphingomonas morindae]USI72872.1 hypothetical protein LHA26_16655 [Sphingomonas morindae]
MSNILPFRSNTPRICSAIFSHGRIPGMTEVTMAEASLHRLAGNHVMLVGAGPALDAFSGRLDHEQYAIRPMPERRDASFARTILDEAEGNGIGLIALDVGGDRLFGGGTFDNQLRTFETARSRGWKTVMKMVLKPGAVEVPEETLRAAVGFSRYAEVHLIEIAARPEAPGVTPPGFLLHRLAHIEPGQLRLLEQSRGLMSDVILNPPPGAALDAALLARTLLDFALSGDFARAMGCGAAIPVLRKAARAATPSAIDARPALPQVSDHATKADDQGSAEPQP